MSEAEKSTSPLIPNLDDAFYEEEAIKQDLHNAGFSVHDQEWLVEFFKRPDTFRNPSGSSVFKEGFEDGLGIALRTVKEKVHIAKDCQTALAVLFSLMLEFGPGSNLLFLPNGKFDKSSVPSSHPEWIGEFQKHANFCAQSLNQDKLSEMSSSAIFYVTDLLTFLFPDPLNQIVDLDRLNPIRRRGWSSNDFEDSSQLEFWLKWRFEDNEKRHDTIRLDRLLKPFSDFPEEILGENILGLLNSIGYALNLALGPGAALNEGWQLVARELLPFLELLNEKQPELHQERSSLLKAWWRLARVIYGWDMGGLESELSPELRNRLVESAARHIGILRSVLRDKPEVFADKEDENSTGSVSDFYQDAFRILLTLAPPWKCLKPLLLAFTEMTVQAVTSDLRSWNEYGDNEKLPYPYSDVPLWVAISMYPQNLRKELEKDPHLQGLREEFAKFCLDRLKTKNKRDVSDADKQSYTNEDFIESRPAWRQGYVRSVTALRVNPGGRAHRTLYWLSKNDPNETIRDSAEIAHKQIRHLDRKKSNLDDGASPRRPLFEAFWWLRQAHLVNLGIKIDEPGAMRTRRRELHRTQEKDDRRNWERVS